MEKFFEKSSLEKGCTYSRKLFNQGNISREVCAGNFFEDTLSREIIREFANWAYLMCAGVGNVEFYDAFFEKMIQILRGEVLLRDEDGENSFTFWSVA